MDQIHQELNKNKRSLGAMILIIISVFCAVLYWILRQVFFGATFNSFSNALLCLLNITPIILLLLYIAIFQNKQKITIFVPLVFIALTIYFVYNIISTIIFLYNYSNIGLGFYSTLNMIFCIPLIVFSCLLIAKAFKGLKKKSLIIVFSIIMFVREGYKLLSLFDTLMYSDSIFIEEIIMQLAEIISWILFAIALIIFVKKSNIPSIIKAEELVEEFKVVKQESIANFCPVCGEKFSEDSNFCSRCGSKR